MARKKALATQSLANTYPLWSDIRNDEQSVGQQLLNAPAIWVDDLRRQIERTVANYYLPTSIIPDVDVYYQFNLPKTYEFDLDNDNSENLFSVPIVSGLIGTTNYLVEMAEDNSMEGFWYNAIPDRVSLNETLTGTINDHLLFSGYLAQCPLLPLTTSGNILVANRLSVTLSGATTCFSYQDNKVQLGTIRLTGTTRAGVSITEDVHFLFDDTIQTTNEFASVSGLDGFGIEDPDETFVIVTSARLGNKAIAEESYFRAAYDQAVNIFNVQKPWYWATSSGQVITHPTQHTLDLCSIDGDDPTLWLDGHVTKSPILRFELLDQSQNHIAPVGLAVEPWSNRIWIADSYNLYVYLDEIPYPNTKPLLGKNYDTDAVIEPESYTVVSGESIDLRYVWRRPVISITRHRSWVEKPDGTKYSLEPGSGEVPYHADSSSWIVGEPIRKAIRPTETYTLDQRGDYIYSLETQYADDTSSIDKRIVSVVYKQPEAQYSLISILGSNRVIGLDIDSENKLWVFDTAGQRHRLNLHYDIMLVDISKKTLYFRENYDQIRVF